MKNSPAEGERRAASGYRGQYVASASIILEALNAGDLLWIKVADPQAGRVDDLQISTTARIDAYQVKWAQYSSSFTWNDLTQEVQNKPSLLAQLADGWKRLRQLHPSERVVVHLHTNQYPSSSSAATMPKSGGAASPYHFAAFIAQAWNPFREDSSTGFSKDWEPVWRAIRTGTNLEEDEFDEFVRDCSLDFEKSSPTETREISELSSFLFATAASPQRTIKLSRNDLIARLDWKDKYSAWNTHEFPEPRYTYRAIQNTVDELETAFHNLDGGYFAVLGSPGSGKSTLLTQTLRKLPVRLVRYYAYVPDSQTPTSVRGESLNFLHDVILKLREAGFGKTRVKDPLDRLAMLNFFNDQIRELGIDFKNSGIKTVLMIDGLDHIEREQNPARSLLLDLPQPNEIPQGVFVILGSQSLDLRDLPVRVRSELEKPDRHLEMNRMSKTDVRFIVSAAIPGDTDNEIDKIHELSNGHPLALIYLLKRLQHLGLEDRVQVLQDSEPFKGNIEELYFSYWNTFATDIDLINTLGLLSRMRGPISLEWAATWTDQQTIAKVNKLFPLYFERDGQGRWQFFHNSFRLFLVGKTAQAYAGKVPEVRDKEFHNDLATLCKASQAPWSWEALYHFHLAGDHKSVLSIATWQWFMAQARALRPVDAIKTDVKLALRSAAGLKSVALVARLTLIGAATEQRSRVLEDQPLAQLLLRSNNPALAADYLHDGNRLRVDSEKALSACPDLFRAGMVREATRIFELSEPYDLLSGRLIPDDNTRPQNLWELLDAWVKSAVLFRGAQEIVQTIKRIKLSGGHGQVDNSEIVTLRLQKRLLYQAAIACADLSDWESWRLILEALQGENQKTERLFVLLRSADKARESNTDLAKEMLTNLNSEFPISFFAKIPNIQTRINASVSFAELLMSYNYENHEIYEYLSQISEIPLYEADLGYMEERTQIDMRFRLARLKYLLGGGEDPESLSRIADDLTVFPQFSDPEERKLYRILALATFTAARLWAWGKKGESSLAPASFVQEIEWIVDLVGRNWTSFPTRSRFQLSDSRGKVLESLVVAAEQNGPETVNLLAERIAASWIDENEAKHWWSGLQRKIVVYFAEAGIGDSWVEKQLKRIEPHMLKELDPYGRADECKDQANAWFLIGETKKGFLEISRMINAARGLLSEKDYQFEELAKWLQLANNLDADNRNARTVVMLRRLSSVKSTASGLPGAAVEILASVFAWSPKRAVLLFKSMVEKDYVDHVDGLSQLCKSALEFDSKLIREVTEVICGLLIPFAKEPSADILHDLIVAAGTVSGTAQAKSLAFHLAKTVNVFGFAHSRSGWTEGIIAGLSKLGIPSDGVHVETVKPVINSRESQLDRNLYLRDGRVLSEADAADQIQTVQDFSKILELEDAQRSSWFDWVKLAELVAARSNDENDLVNLQAVVLPKLSGDSLSENKLAKFHVDLSKKFLKFGNLEKARFHALEAISALGAFGWDPYWDGGVKHQALRQLRQVDPVNFDSFAFEMYGKEISEQAYYPTNLVVHLKDILEILSGEIPVQEVWPEIEAYMADLFVNSNLSVKSDLEDTLSIDLENETDGPAAALRAVLCMYLDYPSYTVVEGAVQGLANLLDEEPFVHDLAKQVKKVFLDDEDAIERCLIALDAVSLAKQTVLEEFRPELEKISLSPNFVLRLIAAKLMSRLEQRPLVVPSLQLSRPAIYEIQLPRMSTHQTEREIEHGSSPIMLADPARLLRPLDIELRSIAEIAGLSSDNVLFRAGRLFNSFVTQHRWLNNGQKISDAKLRAFLENAGILAAHNKPHISAARRSLAHVIGELWDSGDLIDQAYPLLESMLVKHDPFFVRLLPVERPGSIGAMGNSESSNPYQRFDSGWVEGASESFGMCPSQLSAGRLVIAELTKLKILEEDWPSEVRYSLMKDGLKEVFLPENIDGQPFHSEFHLMASDYLTQEYPLDELVIMSNAQGYETRGKNWLAFNPSLAVSLGWKEKPSGLFSWVDSAGSLMAESVWWSDGLIDLYERHLHEEVGEGWIVILSKPGMETLRQHFSLLRREVIVSRSIGWLGDKGSKQHRTVTTVV